MAHGYTLHCSLQMLCMLSIGSNYLSISGIRDVLCSMSDGTKFRRLVFHQKYLLQMQNFHDLSPKVRNDLCDVMMHGLQFAGSLPATTLLCNLPSTALSQFFLVPLHFPKSKSGVSHFLSCMYSSGPKLNHEARVLEIGRTSKNVLPRRSSQFHGKYRLTPVLQVSCPSGK